MKKSICILLSAVLLFSSVIYSFATEIFYQNAAPPVITSVVTNEKNGIYTHRISFSSSLNDAETVRTATEDAVTELLGGKEALIGSEYAYLTKKTLNILQASTDRRSWVTVAVSSENDGAFTVSHREDIVERLHSEGADISALANGDTFYIRILTASENFSEESLSDIFVYVTSEEYPIISPAFGFIDYILPDGTSNNEKNPVYFSLPLENDIILYSPVREGYIFDGWSVDGEARTGKITAGSVYVRVTSHWMPIEYEINYVLTTDLSYNFGKADMTNMPHSYTVGEGAIISDIKSPVIGYSFDGWYYEKDFSGERVTEILPGETGTRLLYAKWKKTETDVTDKETERLEFIEQNRFGDVDDDGKISASDARLVLRAVVGLEELNDSILKRADYRGTGKIFADNARTTLRLAVGLDDLYTILLENGVLP